MGCGGMWGAILGAVALSQLRARISMCGGEDAPVEDAAVENTAAEDTAQLNQSGILTVYTVHMN